MSPNLRGRRTRNARSTTGARKRTGGGRANWPTIIRERRPVYAAAERVARPARRPASTARISTAGGPMDHPVRDAIPGLRALPVDEVAKALRPVAALGAQRKRPAPPPTAQDP